MASSSGAAAITTVLLVVLLATTGWPAPASGEKETPIKCKDCNSTCAATINTSPSECGRAVCGGPTPECVQNCVSECVAGCQVPPGGPVDSCYRECNSMNSQRRCRSRCCPSPEQCEEIINGVMQKCVAECRTTCKGCAGHA